MATHYKSLKQCLNSTDTAAGARTGSRLEQRPALRRVHVQVARLNPAGRREIQNHQNSDQKTKRYQDCFQLTADQCNGSWKQLLTGTTLDKSSKKLEELVAIAPGVKVGNIPIPSAAKNSIFWRQMQQISFYAHYSSSE